MASAYGEGLKGCEIVEDVMGRIKGRWELLGIGRAGMKREW